MSWACAVFSVLLVSAAQLMMRLAMMRLPSPAGPVGFIVALPVMPMAALLLLTGVLAYALSMLCWLKALVRLPLSHAYPLLSLSYLLVWAGALCIPVLHETFHWGKLAGGALILCGVLAICWPDKKNRSGG